MTPSAYSPPSSGPCRRPRAAASCPVILRGALATRRTWEGEGQEAAPKRMKMVPWLRRLGNGEVGDALTTVVTESSVVGGLGRLYNAAGLG